MANNDYEAVFDFIVKFKTSHDGVAPTVQEICDEMGWKSKNTGAYALTRLEELGMIRIGGQARMIQVIGGAWSIPTITGKE